MATYRLNDRLGESGISECRSYPRGMQTPAVALWMCLSQTEGILHGQPGRKTATLAKTTESVHAHYEKPLLHCVSKKLTTTFNMT